MRLIPVLCCAVASGACATTTVVRSDPPDALVASAGQEVGRTPMSYRSHDLFWQTRVLEVSAPGYQTELVLLKRSEINPAISLLSAGLIAVSCWPGGLLLFMAAGMEYPGDVFVRLRPEHRLEPTPAPVLPAPIVPPPQSRPVAKEPY